MRALLGFAAVVAQIRVLSPDSLALQLPNEGRVVGTTATFGVPYYGQRLVGELKYAPSKHPENGPHCSKDDYDLGPPPDPKERDNSNGPAPLLNIVIVKRGTCTFVHKVMIAQEEKKAHAVIIVDQENSPYTSADIQNLIMGDDGYGSKVNIPSILVPKEEGRKLILAVEEHKRVVVELAWDVPVDRIVKMDMWMSAAAEELRQFIREFEPIREELGWNLAFYPHYHVISLPTKDYNNNCWNEDAAYCTDDPDGPGPVTGRDVLEESVRQLCILEKTRQEDPSGKSKALYSILYWKYLAKFQADCPVKGPADDPARRFGKDCADGVRNALLSSSQNKEVDSCLSMNALKYLDEHRGHVAWSSRAVRINGWRYMGQIDADAITRAICSGYVDEPSACSSLRLHRFTFEDQSSTMTFGTFITVVALIVLGAFAGLACYRRVLTAYVRSSIREEVMLEVKHQMTDYAPLRD
jgi:hypothetical protein